MPSEFKGTILALEKINIIGGDEAASVVCRLQFLDQHGHVHAVHTHKLALPMEKEPELNDAVNQLIRVLTKTFERLHYNDAGDHASSAISRPIGIAEALREDLNTTGDPGEQG